MVTPVIALGHVGVCGERRGDGAQGGQHVVRGQSLAGYSRRDCAQCVNTPGGVGRVPLEGCRRAGEGCQVGDLIGAHALRVRDIGKHNGEGFRRATLVGDSDSDVGAEIGRH